MDPWEHTRQPDMIVRAGTHAGADSRPGGQIKPGKHSIYPLLRKSGGIWDGLDRGRPGLSEDHHARAYHVITFVGGSCDRGRGYRKNYSNESGNRNGSHTYHSFLFSALKR